MAGSVKQTWNALGPGADIVAVEMDWTGDASTGSVPVTLAQVGQAAIQGFAFVTAKIVSQSPAPTSGYSVQILEESGIDVLQGAGLSISASALSIGIASNISPLYGSFSLVVTGNAVSGAKGRVVIFFRRISLTQMVTLATQTSSSGGGGSSASPFTLTSTYEFSRSPSVSLTGGVAATVALSPMPSGITSASPNAHYLRITDLVSGSETVLITARTTTTITFTPASSHTSGNWSIGSATAGFQEAMYATTVNDFQIPQGNIDVYQQAWCPRSVRFQGLGENATLIRLNSTTQNLFVADSTPVHLSNLRVSAVGTQTAGRVVSITGAGAADFEFVNCYFFNCYDVAYFNCLGGFARSFQCYYTGIINRSIYVRATGASLVQIMDNYMDGAQSIGLISLEGIIAGGIISGNWMQASKIHIGINSTGAPGPTNELVIIGNMLDQDQPVGGTGVIVISGTGVEATSSNCIKITGNFMASYNFCVLAQDAWQVQVTDNHMRCRGADAAVAISGPTVGVCGKIFIADNDIDFDASTTASYAIQLGSPTLTACTVSGNKGQSGAAMTAFIGLAAGTAITNLFMMDNSAGANFARLVNVVAAVGEGQVACQGNMAANIPSVAIGAAATVTLPIVDAAQPIGVAVTGIAITEMNGPTSKTGSRVTFWTPGIVTWSVSAATNNKIGLAYATGAGGGVVTFVKYFDNLWYPITA